MSVLLKNPGYMLHNCNILVVIVALQCAEQLQGQVVRLILSCWKSLFFVSNWMVDDWWF